MNESTQCNKKPEPSEIRNPILGIRLAPGLTLVELLTGFAIVGVIGIMIGTVYLAHFRLFSTQSTSIDIKTQNTLAMDDITNELKQARYVSSCGFPLCWPASESITTNSSEITVKLWPLDANGKVLTQSDLDSKYSVGFAAYDFINYKLVNNQIKKKIVVYSQNYVTFTSSRNKNYPLCGIGSIKCATTILASNVNSLTFNYYKNTDGSETSVPLTDYQIVENVKVNIKTLQNTTPPKPSPNTITQSEKINFINFDY